MASQYFPRKGVAYIVTFPIYGGDTTPQTGVSGLDSEISKDGGAFTDCTNEATEIGTTGWYQLTLTATEMNADRVAVQVKTTSHGTTGVTINTVELDDVNTVPGFPGDIVVVT